jgi:hypothetical protein
MFESASSSAGWMKLYPELIIFSEDILLPLIITADISPKTALRIKAGTGGRKTGFFIT